MARHFRIPAYAGRTARVAGRTVERRRGERLLTAGTVLYRYKNPVYPVYPCLNPFPLAREGLWGGAIDIRPLRPVSLLLPAGGLISTGHRKGGRESYAH